MRFTNLLCLAVLATITMTASAQASELTKESLAEIKAKVDTEKAVLVDVREKKEWQEGHIKDAIFLPLSSLRDGIAKDELKPLPKDKILYVHCVVGKRAVAAAKLLEKYGYEVRAVKPGYKEMISAGYPKAKE